jgi:hypothetical protein
MIHAIGDTNWQVRIIGVYVGSEQFTDQAANNAIFDIGVSSFYLNTKFYNSVINSFFKSCN